MEYNTSSEFEPKILGFLCNWCSYAGADLAGVSRLQYPPNLRILRVMCSGRVDPVFVVDALIEGVDGVLIAGCHPGDCHYQEGNFQAELRINALTEALAYTNIRPGRVRLEWVSASEGARFKEVVTDFTAQIKVLGPNPVGYRDNKNEDVIQELRSVGNLFAEHRPRTLIGKQKELVEKGNVYDEFVDRERLENIIGDSLRNGYIRNYILVSAKTKPRSIKELASKLRIKPQRVLNEISVLLRKNLLAIDSIEGRTPQFLSIVPGDDA